jgi:hypothetical protein
MVRSAAANAFAGVVGGAVVAGFLALAGADVSPGTTGEVPAAEYHDVLARELLMDRTQLGAARDSVAAELALALLWVNWIDEKRTAPSHTLMEGIKNLLDPVTVALRSRAVGEMDRLRHWSAVPDPGLREDLQRYHRMGDALAGIGTSELATLRTHASTVLARTEWSWMFDIELTDSTFVTFRDNVRLFATDDFRTAMRLVAVSLAQRLEHIDGLLTLNADLESRIRALRGGA